MKSTVSSEPAVWFPAIRAGSGTDVFTERLAAALQKRGIRAEISWLPHYAEFAPWLLQKPKPPSWATVVHCNSWLHRRLIPGNLPLVVTLHSCVHDPALEPYKSTMQNLYHRWWVHGLEEAAIRRANRVTAVSKYTANQGVKVFGRPDIQAIYNWIDTDTFHPADNKETGKPFRLLFIGNLIPRKGVDLLPEIMRRLGGDYVLYFTGDPGYFGSSGQLPPNMVSLGQLRGDAAVVEACHNAEVFLFPTRLEGFGLSVAEAQACGLPVVSTLSSSIPEVVDDGVSGVLCPVDDVDAFVAAIKRLRQEPHLLSAMSKAAVERARQFSEEAAVDQYIDIYQELSR